jgi:hypothetical protein
MGITATVMMGTTIIMTMTTITNTVGTTMAAADTEEDTEEDTAAGTSDQRDIKEGIINRNLGFRLIK